MKRPVRKSRSITITINLSRVRKEFYACNSNKLRYRMARREAVGQATRAVDRYLEREFNKWYRGIESDISK